MLDSFPRRLPFHTSHPISWRGRALLAPLAGLLSIVLVGVMPACAISRGRVEPVPVAASSALGEARAIEQRGEVGWRVRARARAEEARAAARDWVAPQRFLDDLSRSDLLGPEALAEHLATLAVHPASAAELYLSGRLEGQEGRPRFTRALRQAPDSSWAHHGRSWMRFQAGNARGALGGEDAAIGLARDPWERSHFRIAKSRVLSRLGRTAAAIELLIEALEDPGLLPLDRRAVLFELTKLELESGVASDRGRGFWRAIEILHSALPLDPGFGDLLPSMLRVIRAGVDAASFDELEAALALGSSPVRRQLRARLFLRRGIWSFALELPSAAPVDIRLRVARLAAGEGREVVEAWINALPSQVLDSDGMPRREALAEIVRAARAGNDVPSRARLARAMLAAGWFQEARGIASNLVSDDLELALELDGFAVAGRSILGGMAGLVRLVDEGARYGGPRGAGDGTSAGDARVIDSLDDLLSSIDPLLLRHLPGYEGGLEASPSLGLGPFARVIHPGPTFSAADERAGRGSAGERVPGLAAVFGQLGRFGVFGSAPGTGGPDGAILRLLCMEERRGEHLGVPFSGTVAWCEGADLRSRAGRLGARISGAALHEGYWIDVHEVRVDWRRWRALERAFFRGDDGRAERALAVQGPLLSHAVGARSSEEERGRIYAPLGESRRIRLAVLRDRRAAGSSMTLEELLEVTARHEEGHLTERARFLPISDHLFRTFGLLSRAGFSPRRLTTLLEYRAQLVALCVARDPRIPLAECADAVEGGMGITVHGAAYRKLLRDFLVLLAERHSEFEALDPERYLIHQLHRLRPDEIRSVSLELARDEGLVAG